MSAEPVLPRPGSEPPTTRLAAPAPGAPEPLATEPAASRWLVVPGFLVLTGCLEIGQWVKARFGLILPGNILGLFLLLALLLLGIVPLRWVESAARLLLFLLPFLFAPIFIPTLSDWAFWAAEGKTLVTAVILGSVLLWAFAGHLSQFLLRKAEGGRWKAEGRQRAEGRGQRAEGERT